MSDNDDEKKNLNVSYKDITRFVFHFFNRYKYYLLLANILFIVSVIFESITPIYIGKIVDIMSTQNWATISAGDTHEIIICFVLLISLKFLAPLANKSAEILSDYSSTGALKFVITELVAKVQRFSADWHANSFAGATARKIIRGAWAMIDIYFILASTLVPAILVAIATDVVLFYKSPIVAGVFLVLCIIYTILNIYISVKHVRPRFKAFIAEDTKVSAQMNDIITGIQTVKSFAAEEREDKQIDEQASNLRDKAFHAFWFSDFMNIVRAFLEVIVYGAMIATITYMWYIGKATVGDIVLVSASAAVVTSRLQSFGYSIAHLQRGFNDIEDAVDFWIRKDEMHDAEDAELLKISDIHAVDRIIFKDVTFKYPNTDNNLFNKLTIGIGREEKVALVGKSGSGKSTFIKLLQRMYDIESGEILIDGQNIKKVTQKSLREKISLVPQDPILFHRSLKDNIAYGKPDASMEEIIEAAKRAYIHDFISELKDGYDTKVGERGIKLSGGERQRVAIARAILADKPILILDEATSSLDSVSEYYVKQAMTDLMSGKTTITVAHRLSTIKNADRILVFSNGEIIEQGTHDELMVKEKSKYKQLYDMQSLGVLDSEID